MIQSMNLGNIFFFLLNGFIEQQPLIWITFTYIIDLDVGGERKENVHQDSESNEQIKIPDV